MYRFTYTFLFTESHAVTDIQVAELTALLPSALEQPALPVLIGTEDHPYEFAAPHVYVRRFFQSCQVFSPCEINLGQIIRRASYVHSCGPTVLCAEWESINVDTLVQKISEYGRTLGRKLQVEFFSERRHEASGAIANLFIDETRYFLGRTRLQAACNSIPMRLEDLWKQNGITEPAANGALFIVKDTLFKPSNEATIVRYLGREDVLYLIAYYSLYKKRDALLRLDESKPFWAGIFTTPQNLTAAMLNIARVNRDSTLLDPFSHQGSTPIQAICFGCKIVLYSDLFEVWGTRDNVAFLTASPAEQKQTIAEARRILTSNLEGYRRLARESIELPDAEEAFAIRRPVIERLFYTEAPVGQNGVPSRLTEQFSNLASRVLFYALSRAYIRHSATVDDDLERERKVLDEVRGLLEQLDAFTATILRGEEQSSHGRIPTVRVNSIPDPKSRWLALAADAKYLPIATNSLDAIVADPPYGYGADLNEDELVKLWEGFSSEAFRTLKPGGWLVVCLLDKVRTGKQISDRLKAAGIVRRIAQKAREMGVDFEPQVIGTDACCFPVYAPYSAYYWKATYALNRAVVAFQLRRKATAFGKRTRRKKSPPALA